MEQQVHKKTSALTIVGIIVLILGFLGLLGTIYGSIAKDNMLSNLQSQIDSIDEQNAEI